MKFFIFVLLSSTIDLGDARCVPDRKGRASGIQIAVFQIAASEEFKTTAGGQLVPPDIAHWKERRAMLRTLRRLVLVASMGLPLLAAGSPAAAHETDEYWQGYWKWYDGPYRNYYNRPHDLRYGNSQPTLYYGHSPPASFKGADPPYQRGEPPHIGNY